MKVTDVTLTLFSWDDIPATRYSANTGRFSGSSDLGLLTIATDHGIEGNEFSRLRLEPGKPRRAEAHTLSEAVDHGEKSFGARAALSHYVEPQPDCIYPCDRRDRYRALGHRRQSGRNADTPFTRVVSQQRAGLCKLPGP
jgi:hypothetical protein